MSSAVAHQKTDRVLVIGLDGADWDIIQPLLEDGKLPHLEQVMENGTYGDLETTLPIESPVAWTSMTTGTTPGKHGIYGFLERQGDEFMPTTAADVQMDRVWDYAGEDGEVVVVNVPQTFPPEPVNGAMIGGYLSLPEVGYTYPAELQQEIEADGYRIETLDDQFDPEKRDAFLDELDGVVENRTRTAETLLQRRDWTLGFIVYTGLDRLQHYFWAEMEEEHPRYGSAITDHYVALDQQIGRLLAEADENTTVMIVSDHGFGPLQKNVYLNTWLRKNGYLHLDGSTTQDGVLARLGMTQQNVVDVLSSIGLLGPVKDFFGLLGFNPGTSLPAPELSDIDFDRTTVYAGNFGGKIYLTEQVPDSERKELLATLEQELAAITDPATGEPVFGRIMRSGDVYTGTRENAPDLLLEPDGPYRAVGFLGHNTVVKTPPTKTGTHRLQGIYVIAGPGVEAGTGNASIIDITPTILDQLGKPVPADMDGTPIT